MVKKQQEKEEKEGSSNSNSTRRNIIISVICSFCKNEFTVLNEHSLKYCTCSCSAILCSDKCEREHSYGYTIEQLREMEKDEIY